MRRLMRPWYSVAGLCVLLVWGCGLENGNVDAEDPPQSAVAPGDSPRHSDTGPQNRLARESSPYLLLHAHNPVDWYPWGPEAFATAKRENKLVFLSIGYSSCYWCHVMERLVFSNEKIASAMNENFVNIKVDREERPDIDDIYMTSLIVYLRAIGSGQGGGWPLSMFLTPDGKPVAGGTYFPPEDGSGRIGFPSVMQRVVEIWKNKREAVLKNADALTAEVQRVMKPALALRSVKIDRQLVDNVVQSLVRSYDSEFGGIDFNRFQPNSPKFPVPAKLALLQYQVRRHGDEEAAKILEHTLDSMAAGGIRDHLGGGFHRYSTDRRWHVPHFEKMLYDQAQLADTYVEAYRQTGKQLYREAAEGILEYILREMTDPGGGFYSALDAETDGVEGQYYVWSSEEIGVALGADDARIFNRVYGLDEARVFEHGFVLHLPRPIGESAELLKVSPEELGDRLVDMRRKLLDVRQKRDPLLRDDKVLTSWNGLMIRAFAHAGKVFGNEDYVEAGSRAAQFILSHLRDEEGRLKRTYREGNGTLNGYLDDYAFFVEGLLAVYDVTRDEKWLNASRELTDDQLRRFGDEDGNGFFFTSHNHESLIARTKNAYDATLPSGNSVSVRNLIRLASLTGQKPYRTYARQTLELFAAQMKESPAGAANLALALAEYLDDPDFRGSASSEASSAQPAGKSDGPFVRVTAYGPEKKKPKHPYVSTKAFLSVDKLPAGGTCKIVVFLDVKKGWHVNSNPPKPKNLIATKLSVKSKQGVQLRNVRYPAPKEMAVPELEEEQHFYDGRVTLRGTLQIPAGLTSDADDIVIEVRYQACNSRQCLPPKTISLNGRVPIARRGEPVKQINKNLFSKPQP